MSTPNGGGVDQVKTHEEIKGNKNKRSTYVIRTFNRSSSKILVIIKVIRMILIIIVIVKIIIMIKCRGISTTPTTTNTKLPVTLYNGQKPLTNITKISTSDAAWVLYAPLKWLIHHVT